MATSAVSSRLDTVMLLCLQFSPSEWDSFFAWVKHIEMSRFSRIPPPDLTTRQKEILGLIADGHTNKEIANTLHISPKTVDFHKAKLYDRLNVSHRDASLVRYACENALLPIPKTSAKDRSSWRS